VAVIVQQFAVSLLVACPHNRRCVDIGLEHPVPIYEVIRIVMHDNGVLAAPREDLALLDRARPRISFIPIRVDREGCRS